MTVNLDYFAFSSFDCCNFASTSQSIFYILKYISQQFDKDIQTITSQGLHIQAISFPKASSREIL